MKPSIKSPHSKSTSKEMEIFFPHSTRKFNEARKTGMKFVHYSTADTAMKIISGKAVWLRNASCMNDFKEIDHGLECLKYSLAVHDDSVKRVLTEAVSSSFADNLIELFERWTPQIKEQTYIMCLSEHDEVNENQIGRLSMWRAYGGNSGVALVLNQRVFVNPSDALGAYTSPVAYLDKTQMASHFEEIIENIHNNIPFVRSMGEAHVMGCLFHCFRWAILCTKHPGFKEEKEWRVIHGPPYFGPTKIRSEIFSVGGIPQTVKVIDLKNIPSMKLHGASVKDLIDRVIIGPTKFPIVTRDAFKELLKSNHSSAEVYVSDIPLRV